MTKQAEALRLADLLDAVPFIGFVFDEQPGMEDPSLAKEAAVELRRLHEENQRLKTVMIAAAEEIAKHWEAHCDVEGYGPVNLLHRLEKGIASEYNYTAGSFARLHDANQELLKPLLAWEKAYCDKDFSLTMREFDLMVRAAIAKATGEH